jgi:hypothetical protein
VSSHFSQEERKHRCMCSANQSSDVLSTSHEYTYVRTVEFDSYDSNLHA